MARTLERLTQAIESRGGAVRIVTVADPEAGPDPRVERWPSVPFWAYPQLRMAAPSRRRARDVIERWKPTLVHVVTEFGVGLGGLLAARDAGVPVVSSYHTNFQAYLEFYRLGALDRVAWPFFRWVHNRGRRTFAPSAYVARDLEAHGSRFARRIDFSATFCGSTPARTRARRGRRLRSSQAQERPTSKTDDFKNLSG